MSNSRMVDAVNRLTCDLLSGVGEVFLPDVGSLYVERHGSQRVSNRKILPPCRVVAFSSRQRGASLVDEIAAAAQVDGVKAEEIYRTWLSRVQSGETLTIEGVGILKFKHFTLDPEFDKLLNPLGHQPVSIKQTRRFDWALWIGVAAILFAAGFGGYQFLMTYPDPPQQTREQLPAESNGQLEVSEISSADELAEPSVDSVAVPVGAEGVVQESVGTSVSELADNVENVRTVLTPVSGRRYVVLGVFSTPENALRAVEQTIDKEPAVRLRIYRFGDKFMVSPFESEDAAACTEFIRSHGDRFQGLWTYSAR